MPLAIAILVLAAGWRVFTLYVPPLSNFSPVMALAFCAGAYYRRGWIWLPPVWGVPPFHHLIQRPTPGVLHQQGRAGRVAPPQFYPTLFFFRTPLASDLLFTGCFALAMEYAFLRRGDPSLLSLKQVRR